MKLAFGPWTTAIHVGSQPQLSTFWKRRMTMLVSTSQSQPALSRRDYLRVGVLCFITCALPTLRGVASQPKEKNKPEEDSPGRIAVSVQMGPEVDPPKVRETEGIFVVDPQTGKVEQLFEGKVGPVRLSPDGKHLVHYDWSNNELLILDTSGQSRQLAKGWGRATLTAQGPVIVWSSDGTQVVCSMGQDSRSYETWLFDVDGSQQRKLSIPGTDKVQDWSPDGQWFLTSSSRHKGATHLYLMKTDGTQQRRLTVGQGMQRHPAARFSPDGRRIVYTRREFNRGTFDSLWVVGVDGKHPVRIFHKRDVVPYACWSPNGQRLLVRLHDLVWEPEPLRKNFRLAIMDTNGKNHRPFELPDDFQFQLRDPAFVSLLDWR